ncbi:MAG: hypothetical protein J6W21_01155 [Bacteroidaceae bacterium]|nr:hypothetical protein [Bacteroidaceae bacterium]
MKTKFFLYAGLMACFLTACNDESEFSDIEKKVRDGGKSMKVEVTDEFAESATRADYSGFPSTTFEEGDAIGVYAFNGSSYVSSNIKFTRQSDGSWTPASSVIFNPDYTYYAYFPWRSSTYTPSTGGTADAVDTKFSNFISDSNNYFWQANQSTKAGFTYSNLMIAKGIVTGSRTVKFTMAHKRGLAIISPAVNQWYYTDDAGTKYNLSPVFSGNIPYEESGTRYFLLKPNTTTSVAGLSLRAGAGKYMTSAGIEMTGTPSYTYKVYHYGQSSPFSTSKPSWVTVTPNVVDGEPTELAVTVTNSTSTTYSKGSGMSRTVTGDATLKAASPVSNVDLSMVDNAGSARASRTTANCYLVHAPGTYKIPLVYGNAIKNGNEASTASFYTSNTSNTLQRLVNHADAGITSPWIKTQLGSCPDGAQLIWEDVKGIISSVDIDTSGNGFLTFTVDADNIAEGNAVIAATLSGTVVWSWHIWVTTQTLSGLTTIATGSHNYQVAPVNVGQITGTIVSGATIYAGDICTVTCTNNGVSMEFTVTAKDYTSGGTTYYNPSPYYQWGRKDAMYPSTGGYNSAGTLISTYSGSTLINATSATPGATIQHPNYWYYNSSNYGPYGTNSTYAGKYNYWDMNQTSTGNITTATVKTVYDPCPPGFCVPTGNLYYYMGNTGSSNSSYGTWQSTPPGRTWIYGGANNFFPASGLRDYSNGSLSNVGSYGCYWSASAYSSGSGHYLYFYSSSWGWNYDYRAYGFPVRAVAEE